MNDFTKEELQEYIAIRRNGIGKLIDGGIIPGVLDNIELTKLQGVLEEFETMEIYFGVTPK